MTDYRPPTAPELVASIVYFDRYLAFEGDAVAFWRTLTPTEQDHADYLVRVVAQTLAPDPDTPQCPRHCDVATRPEAIGRGRWLCTSCGNEFTWPPEDAPRVVRFPVRVDDVSHPTR